MKNNKNARIFRDQSNKTIQQSDTSDGSELLEDTKQVSSRLSLRINPDNPDHHLWNNNGTWWCHYTEHLPDYTKRRVRVSLGTSDLKIARRRRDELLSDVGTLALAA
jgi:hypothetical protein